MSLTIALLFVFSVTTGAFAAETPNSQLKAENPSVISSQVKKIDGREVVTKKFNDKGKIVTVLSGDVSDKKAVIQELETSNPISLKSEFHDYTFNAVGTSPENNNVVVSSSVVFRAGHTNHGLEMQETVNNGYTKGYLYGSTPLKADQIILRQQYTMTAVALGFSVGWPASISISGSVGSQTGTWVSAPYTNCWSCSAPHDHVVVHSATGKGMSADVEDGADVYISNHCYKARTSISKTWLELDDL